MTKKEGILEKTDVFKKTGVLDRCLEKTGVLDRCFERTGVWKRQVFGKDRCLERTGV